MIINYVGCNIRDGDNSNSIKYDNKNSNELSSITLVNVY